MRSPRSRGGAPRRSRVPPGLTAPFALSGDDQRLEADGIPPRAHLVKPGRVQPSNELIGSTVVRVELRELTHQIIRDAVGLHARRDEDPARSQPLVTIRVELHEQLVVQELAKSGGGNDVEVRWVRRGVERVTEREDEAVVGSGKLAR